MRFEIITDNIVYDNDTESYYEGVWWKEPMGMCRKCHFYTESSTPMSLEPCNRLRCRSIENENGLYRFWLKTSTCKRLTDNRTEDEKAITDMILG